MRLAEGSRPALDQRRIGQNPAVQGGVVHRQAALQEQLLDVPVAERVAQIPRDGLQDQRRLEMPAFEVLLGPGASASRQSPSGSWRPPELEATKSTTLPDEPSTPEICDRPPEKHKQLSATPGNLTLSRAFKGGYCPSWTI